MLLFSEVNARSDWNVLDPDWLTVWSFYCGVSNAIEESLTGRQK